MHFLYKARIKAETTSIDDRITRLWLEMFRDSLSAPTPAAFGGA